LVDAPGIGLFCPNKECDVIDNIKGEEPVKFAPIEIEYKFVDKHNETDPDLHVMMMNAWYQSLTKYKISSRPTKNLMMMTTSKPLSKNGRQPIPMTL
jgi:hypothetical protein